jgi:L-fucose mutarotase/ribose pyranase (RbsD/FucU family)
VDRRSERVFGQGNAAAAKATHRKQDGSGEMVDFSFVAKAIIYCIELNVKARDVISMSCIIQNSLFLQDTRREVDASKGEAFATKHGMTYIETSAIDTKNVKEAFAMIVGKADRAASAADQDANAAPSGQFRLIYLY